MIDGVNRVALFVLGLAAVAAGGLGLAAGQDAFGRLHEPSRLYRDARRAVLERPDHWFWISLGVCVAVLLVMLIWLIRQFRSRPGPPHLSTEILDANRRGRTTVESAKFANAIGDDFTTVDGVRGSSVRVTGLDDSLRLRARLDIDRDADPDDVLARCESVLDRAAAVVGASDVQARIRLDFASRDSSRVR